MENYIKELIKQGHSEDTICFYLTMESYTIEESYNLISKVIKELKK